MKEIVSFLQQHNKQFRSHPIVQSLTRGTADIPWIPSISSVAGYFDSIGFGNILVANTTVDYYRLAVNLVQNR